MSREYLEAKNVHELCSLLGLPVSQAPKIEMRRDLIIAIRRTIDVCELTHAKAAKTTNVGRTVITAIVNGNIDKISTDRLINIASALGLDIHLKIGRRIKAPRRITSHRILTSKKSQHQHVGAR